jgi:hypothetical protein
MNIKWKEVSKSISKGLLALLVFSSFLSLGLPDMETPLYREIMGSGYVLSGLFYMFSLA